MIVDKCMSFVLKNPNFLLFIFLSHLAFSDLKINPSFMPYGMLLIVMCLRESEGVLTYEISYLFVLFVIFRRRENNDSAFHNVRRDFSIIKENLLKLPDKCLRADLESGSQQVRSRGVDKSLGRISKADILVFSKL